MAIKFIQEKEKQKTLVYVLVFLVIFFILFLLRGISFDFSAKEALQKEDVVEVNFSMLDEMGIENLREFPLIPSYQELIQRSEDQNPKIGRENPLLSSSMSPQITEEEEIEMEETEEESQEELEEEITE